MQSNIDKSTSTSNLDNAGSSQQAPFSGNTGGQSFNQSLPGNLDTGSAFVENSPTSFQRIEKPVVVHEKILPTRRTEVQPVIHRQREVVEVHKVLQPMKERDIAPTQVAHVELPAEYRGMSGITPQTVSAPMSTAQTERPPIVHENVHKKIIEEVQPVLYREVVRPVVVEATKPIWEKVVEAPRLVEQVLPMRDLGTKYYNQQGQNASGQNISGQNANVGQWDTRQLSGENQFSPITYGQNIPVPAPAPPAEHLVRGLWGYRMRPLPKVTAMPLPPAPAYQTIMAVPVTHTTHATTTTTHVQPLSKSLKTKLHNALHRGHHQGSNTVQTTKTEPMTSQTIGKTTPVSQPLVGGPTTGSNIPASNQVV